MGDARDAVSGGKAEAVLGGGCFWCLEAVFENLRGVSRVESGYAGGSVANPSYEAVCTGRTGHAEVVRVEFDPGVLDYRDLLRVFFATHDPTTLNRQGADVGTQYRSAIFPRDGEQERVAREVMAELGAGPFAGRPIVTTIESGTFYPAEDYHRGYYRAHRAQPYCRAVIDPKVAKLRSGFAGMLRDSDG